MSGALFRAQQWNTMENGVEIAFIVVFIMIMNKLQITGKIANCEQK